MYNKKDYLKYFFKKYQNQEMLTEEELDNIICFPQLDYARDSIHFGIKTTKNICNLIVEKIKTFDF